MYKELSHRLRVTRHLLTRRDALVHNQGATELPRELQNEWPSVFWSHQVKRNLLNVSYHIAQYTSIISDLRREIERLKAKIENQEKEKSMVSSDIGDAQGRSRNRCFSLLGSVLEVCALVCLVYEPDFRFLRHPHPVHMTFKGFPRETLAFPAASHVCSKLFFVQLHHCKVLQPPCIRSELGQTPVSSVESFLISPSC